ncbi:MAG: hypothetical protein ORN57_04790 [Alphaproteobacteria bacterium]|nr:hypothetical protein [Alphaproteobacteria bacterium]
MKNKDGKIIGVERAMTMTAFKKLLLASTAASLVLMSAPASAANWIDSIKGLSFTVGVNGFVPNGTLKRSDGLNLTADKKITAGVNFNLNYDFAPVFGYGNFGVGFNYDYNAGSTYSYGVNDVVSDRVGEVGINGGFVQQFEPGGAVYRGVDNMYTNANLSGYVAKGLYALPVQNYSSLQLQVNGNHVLMGNVNYKLPIAEGFSARVGLGLGVDVVSATVDKFGALANAATPQVGAENFVDNQWDASGQIKAPEGYDSCLIIEGSASMSVETKSACNKNIVQANPGKSYMLIKNGSIDTVKDFIFSDSWYYVFHSADEITKNKVLPQALIYPNGRTKGGTVPAATITKGGTTYIINSAQLLANGEWSNYEAHDAAGKLPASDPANTFSNLSQQVNQQYYPAQTIGGYTIPASYANPSLVGIYDSGTYHYAQTLSIGLLSPMVSFDYKWKLLSTGLNFKYYIPLNTARFDNGVEYRGLAGGFAFSGYLGVAF